MEQFIQEFGIDWKLMLAQLINFIVLVFLLAKFAYKPILKALDARRKKIEEGVMFSEKAKAELASIEELKANELEGARRKGMDLVKVAETAASTVRSEILVDAEAQKQKLIATGKTLLAEQKNRMEKGVYDQAVALVEDALGKVLGKTQFKAEEQALIQQAVSEIRVK